MASRDQMVNRPLRGLVHARLEQLFFEWLLLPRTVALVDHLRDICQSADTASLSQQLIRSDGLGGGGGVTEDGRFLSGIPAHQQFRTHGRTTPEPLHPPRSPHRKSSSCSSLGSSHSAAATSPAVAAREPTAGRESSIGDHSPQSPSRKGKTESGLIDADVMRFPPVVDAKSQPDFPLDRPEASQILGEDAERRIKEKYRAAHRELSSLDLSGIESRLGALDRELSVAATTQQNAPSISQEDDVPKALQARRSALLSQPAKTPPSQKVPATETGNSREPEKGKRHDEAVAGELNAAARRARFPSTKQPIPRFYLRPRKEILVEEFRAKAALAFKRDPGDPGSPLIALSRDLFETRVMVELLNMSKLLTAPLFNKILSSPVSTPQAVITLDQFLKFCDGRFTLEDDNATFFNLLRQPHNDFIWGYDFTPFIEEIVKRHPGLTFLRDTAEYRKRYVSTVCTRLLYVMDEDSSGKVTLEDLRRFTTRQKARNAALRKEIRGGQDEHSAPSEASGASSRGGAGVGLDTTQSSPFFPAFESARSESGDSAQRASQSGPLVPTLPTSLPEIWRSFDTSEDLNHERMIFSYEHFYVIYCYFWELDPDHDFQLEVEDLVKYDGHAFCSLTLNRVFAKLLRAHRGTSSSSFPLRMSYEDFVVFLSHDEDKTTDKSIEFWFDIVDLDGDGYIRPFEMVHFYEEQCQRLESLGQELVSFSDVLCQMNDLLKPKTPGQFTIADFKRNRHNCEMFFDILLSLTKFAINEARDPFQARQETADFPDYTPWDRFCKRAYDRLDQEDMDEDYNEEDSNEAVEWEESSTRSEVSTLLTTGQPAGVGVVEVAESLRSKGSPITVRT